MRRLLVRADDLGYCEAVNYGIAKAVKEGIVGSVGLMPNMEAARHGVDLLTGCTVCYGQHTNICNGRPLTDPSLIPSLVQPNGEFKTTAQYREAAKAGQDFVVLEEAVLEIEAQYRRFVELTGQQPHYFEGHAVPSANFNKGLAVVAQKYGLRYLPMTFGEPAVFGRTKLYASMDSMFPDYVPFESLKKAALREMDGNSCVMMICHPGYVDDYVLKTSLLTTQRAEEAAMLTNAETKHWLRENGVRLVTYDDLW